MADLSRSIAALACFDRTGARRRPPGGPGKIKPGHRLCATAGARVAWVAVGLIALLAIPSMAQAAAKVIFLTSGSSWTVPSDWNSAGNTVECLGAGGTGGINSGGSGGAYAKRSNVVLTPGASVSYSVGAANTTLLAAGGTTWFSSASTLQCGGGGSGTASHGDVINAGGAGGAGGSTHNGPGGGGAGGPHGVGASGASTTGTGLPYAGAGGAGDNGSAAGGSGGANFENYQGGSNQGGAGVMETVWTQTSNGAIAGPGGGGGGSGAGFPYSANMGGAGGGYGGGAGAPGRGSPDVSSNNPGGPGIIVITYTPAAAGPPDLAVTAEQIPTTATAGVATNVSGTVQNVGGTTSVAVQSYFQFLDASHNCTTPNFCGTVTASTGALAAGASTPVNASYTYPVAGSYGVRMCTNNNNADSETNTANDCGSWVAVTVSSGAAAGTANYTYDTSGRLTCVATPDGKFTSYLLDTADNRSQVVRNTTGCVSGGNVPITANSSAKVNQNSSGNNIPLSLFGGVATGVTVTTAAGHGTATASGTSISYTPTSGYAGSDSFQFKANNSYGTSSAATVSITVVGTVQPPVANNVVAPSVNENSSNNAIALNITGGTPTSVAVSTQAGHGTATASGTSISYTPTAGYYGSDSFRYTATNSAGTSAPATVSLTVQQVFQPPVANPVSATVNEYSTNNPIALNITGGAATSVALAGAPAHGTATANGTSITYTPATGSPNPASGYIGQDGFYYTASNSGGTSPQAWVTITVNAVPPKANNVTTAVPYNSSGNGVSYSYTNTNGVLITTAIASPPSHGTATVSGGYTPTTGYSGSDSFTYTGTNSYGTSAPATVSITVNPPTSAVAQPDTMTVPNPWLGIGTLSNGNACVDAIANDTNPSHYTLTITGVTQPSQAPYYGSQSYVSSNQACYHASYYASYQDTFTYTISDGHGGTSSATVTVNVVAQ